MTGSMPRAGGTDEQEVAWLARVEAVEEGRAEATRLNAVWRRMREPRKKRES